jgi:putative SOS response-associated peptidase YedK
MCGRFAFYSAHEAIVRLFRLLSDAPEVEPHYNIAPTQYVAAVRLGRDGERKLSMVYWGLVPSWAKDKSIGARMINARAETLRDKPAFRSAYERRRCLVLADGYYEWLRSGAVKQPWFIRLASREPFGMAGLWEARRDPADGELLRSCSIVTTTPAPSIAHLHDRMPVILPPSAHAAWLDPANEDREGLDALLAPPPSEQLEAYPVSRRVNSARLDDPSLVEPVTVEREPDQSSLFGPGGE